MFAYGIAGVCAGFLKKRKIHTMPQVLLTAVYGFFVVLLIVGPILDTGSLFMMANVITKETAGAVYLSGLPVNADPWGGNIYHVTFILPSVVRKIKPYETKVWHYE